jgi:hypothetical protein
VHDGQPVSYSGTPGTLQPGDEGTVLATEPTYAHILWTTGVLAGQVTPHSNEELKPIAVRNHIEASLDDSLEVGSLQVVSARDAYDEGGPAAVVDQLASYGQLAMLMDDAQQTYAQFVAQVRTSPYMAHLAAQLDEGELETVVQTTSSALLRELLAED